MKHTSPIVIVLVGIVGAYAQTAIGILPVMVSSWVERMHFSESAAGFIGSLTLAGMTLGMAGSVFLLKYKKPTWIVCLGVLIALSGDLVSMWQTSPTSLGVIRSVTGLGYGLVYATVVNWFARHEMADRCFGTFMLLQVLMFAPLLTLVPILELRIGLIAPYLCLITLGLLALLLAPLLNLNQAMNRPVIQDETRAVLTVDGISTPMATLAILAPAILITANMGFWAYLLRFGISLGIDEQRLGLALGGVTLTGIPASLGVIWMGNRFGRLKPVLAGVMGLLAPILVFLLGATSFAAFIVCGILFTMAWSFTIPFMQAVQADLDASGKLASLSTIPQAIGAASGPALFAITLTLGDYALGFSLVTGLLLISMGLIFRPALAGERKSSNSHYSQ